MFRLFKSGAPGIKAIDKVWMSKEAKLNACVDLLRVNPTCLFVAWFEETFQELQQLLNPQKDKVNLILAASLNADMMQNHMVVFAEHHPLAKVEQTLFSTLGLVDVPILSSLDEPFFHSFGGERIIDLMKKMGLKENEVLGHPMITRSIHNAQESIAKRATTNLNAISQKDWLATNMRN